MVSKGSIGGSDTDRVIYAPITTVSKRIVGQKSPYGIQLSYINVVAKDSESIEAAQFQITNLFPQLTARENVRVAVQMRYSRFAIFTPA